MRIKTEEIGDVKIILDYVDDPFIRQFYGTYYLKVRNGDRMIKQQVFQERPKAIKYFNKFVYVMEHLDRIVMPDGRILSPNQKLAKDVFDGTVDNKAPWYYNQGKKGKYSILTDYEV
jgi:hypothetical protein